jgi:hypothetical protein
MLNQLYFIDFKGRVLLPQQRFPLGHVVKAAGVTRRRRFGRRRRADTTMLGTEHLLTLAGPGRLFDQRQFTLAHGTPGLIAAWRK